MDDIFVTVIKQVMWKLGWESKSPVFSCVVFPPYNSESQAKKSLSPGGHVNLLRYSKPQHKLYSPFFEHQFLFNDKQFKTLSLHWGVKCNIHPNFESNIRLEIKCLTYGLASSPLPIPHSNTAIHQPTRPPYSNGTSHQTVLNTIIGNNEQHNRINFQAL